MAELVVGSAVGDVMSAEGVDYARDTDDGNWEECHDRVYGQTIELDTAVDVVSVCVYCIERLDYSRDDHYEGENNDGDADWNDGAEWLPPAEVRVLSTDDALGEEEVDNV